MAIDIVIMFIHTIKKGFGKKKLVTVLLIDIKSIFYLMLKVQFIIYIIELEIDRDFMT